MKFADLGFAEILVYVVTFQAHSYILLFLKVYIGFER